MKKEREYNKPNLILDLPTPPWLQPPAGPVFKVSKLVAVFHGRHC